MPLPALPALLACPPMTPNPAVSVEVVCTATIHNLLRRVVDDGSEGPAGLRWSGSSTTPTASRRPRRAEAAPS